MEHEAGAQRKVAIIGKAPSSVKLAPYDDPTWEVWILNTLGVNGEVPRWDRQYELHDLTLTEHPSYGQYNSWLKKQSHGERSVFLRDTPPADWGHAAKKYPLDEIRVCFSNLPRIYLTNTVSLMLAHALFEHAQGQIGIAEMGLWGVDMAQSGPAMGHASWFTSEYAKQRPSCEYWIGVAAGMGIRVTIPEQSDLLKSPCVYGHHHTEDFMKWKARQEELTQRIQRCEQLVEQYKTEATFLAGAREGDKYSAQSRFYSE